MEVQPKVKPRRSHPNAINVNQKHTYIIQALIKRGLRHYEIFIELAKTRANAKAWMGKCLVKLMLAQERSRALNWCQRFHKKSLLPLKHQINMHGF